MRRWARLALLAALLATGMGCGAINALRTKAPDPGTLEGEWAAVRDGATRRAMLYDRLQHRATVTVTYLGPAEREARVRRLGEWLGWTEQELARSLKAELDEAARYDDFLLALYTADSRANDLDKPDSVWRVAVRLDPGEGERVTHDAKVQDADTTLMYLFPYVSRFETVYRVRFDRIAPKPLEQRVFTLEVASAMGKMELTFGDGQLGPTRPEGSPVP